MLNIVVFGSGRGSNFKAVLDAIADGSIPAAHISLVISNNATAGILDIARSRTIPALHISQKQFETESSFVAALLETLQSHGTDLVVLAGYMKRLPPQVVHAYRNRIINIHPALLPRFGGHGMYGIHVHAAVLAAQETVSGATVHLVDEEYDRGPILLQQTVPVLPDDTPEILAARVLLVEHRLLPDAVRLFSEGRVDVNGNIIHMRTMQE
jgi:formyltetrahydrofolate-dependent phosphoribosylglycinamide formyltransferase